MNYSLSLSYFRKVCGQFLFFVLPIHQKASTILIVLCFLLTLLDYKNINFNRLKKNWPLFLFYFAFIIIGSLIREDFKFKYIEYKSPFLAIPFIYHNYSLKDYILFAKSYIIGLLVFYFGLLVNAFINSLEFSPFVFNYKVHPNNYGFIENGIRGGNYFLGEYFTHHLQTSYFALYYSFGIILLYTLNIFKSRKRNFIILVLVIAVLQSFSKAGIILVLFSIAYVVLNYLKIRKWVALVLLAGLTSSVVFLNPRINKTIISFFENSISLNKRSPESLDMRLLTWDASLQAIKHRPFFGHGSTGAQYELNRIYSEKKYRFPLKYRLNAHNLYLQLAVEGGIILLMIFVIVQYIPFFRFGNRDLIFGFTVLTFISFLFESHFSRYIGISFFALFYTLILNLYDYKK